MEKVYISYSRQDSFIAKTVKLVLSQSGCRVFLDYDDLKDLANFAEQLTKQLNAADTVIFIVSELSLNSQWCRREIEYAQNKGKSIIPIVLNEHVLHSESFKNSVVSSLNALIWDANGEEQLRSLIHRRRFEFQKKRIKQDKRFDSAENCTLDSQPIPNEDKSNTERNKHISNSSTTRNGSSNNWGCFVLIVIAVIIGTYYFFISDNTAHEDSKPSEVEEYYVDGDYPEVNDDYDWVVLDSTAVDSIAAEVAEDVIIQDFSDTSKESSLDSTFTDINDTGLTQNIPELSEEEIIDIHPETKSGTNNTWLFILLFVVFIICAIGFLIYKNRKIRIKLVSNKDCTVYADNKEIASLKAKQVTQLKLPKGEFYLLFKPSDHTLEDKDLKLIATNDNELICIRFEEAKTKKIQEVKSEERHTIKCFIAGSTKLEAERNALRSGIAQTHNNWRGKNFEILSYTYEDFERKVVEGGHQSKYDEFIENEATIAVFIISGEIGEFTITEFEKAMNAFEHGKHPQILVFNDINAPMHEQSEKLKKIVSSHKQYWADYESIGALKLQFMYTLDWMLIDMFNL